MKINFMHKIKNVFKKEEIIKILIDLDNTIFDYNSKKNEMLEKYPNQTYPQSQYGFFESLDPLKDAIWVVKNLMSNPRFKVYFATAPSYLNPLCYTGKRVSIETHFGIEACKNLIIIDDKSLLDDRNVFLIDDMDSGNGQDQFFKGKHLKFGGEEYKDWMSIHAFFEKIN